MSTENKKFRILYLTHALTSTGACCLARLIDEGYDVVGVVTPILRYKSNTLVGSVRQLFERRGAPFAILVILRTLWARARAWMAGVFPKVRKILEGFESIDEVSKYYSLNRLYPLDINSPDFIQEALALKPDVVVIGISDKILKHPFLEAFPQRVLNLHPAPLPRHRGPDPLYWQLIMDEAEGGITVHYVSPEIDGGNILEQQFFPIERGETEGMLKRKVDRLAPEVMLAALKKFQAGDKGRAQATDQATYFKQRPKGFASCFPRRPWAAFEPPTPLTSAKNADETRRASQGNR